MFCFKVLLCWPYHLTMVSRKSEKKHTAENKEQTTRVSFRISLSPLYLLELTTNIECRVTLKFNLIKFISRNVLYDWKEAINSPLWRSTSVRVHSYEQPRDLSWLFRSGKTWMNVQDTPHIQRTATWFFSFDSFFCCYSFIHRSIPTIWEIILLILCLPHPSGHDLFSLRLYRISRECVSCWMIDVHIRLVDFDWWPLFAQNYPLSQINHSKLIHTDLTSSSSSASPRVQFYEYV